MIRIGIQREPLEIEIGPSCSPPTASAVPSAIPSRTTGKAQITSSTREITASGQPR